MTYEQRLQDFVGKTLVDARVGQDPVNVPMVRHWVESMGLAPGIFVDEAAAKASGRDSTVAPAAMTQAWIMRGFAAHMNPPTEKDGFAELIDLLDEGGYTSVVATDSDFTFERELVPGDTVTMTEVVEDISEEKRTGLGTGRFVTTKKTYTDAQGHTVATQLWRTLRFAPKEREG